jgi:hypothetical protein
MEQNQIVAGLDRVCVVARYLAGKALVAASLLVFGTLAHSQTFTITFDAGDPIGGLPVGTVLSNQYTASTGATFSANAFSGAGGPTGTWATNTGMTIVSSTGSDVGGLGTPVLVSGNLLRSFNGWLSEDGDASMRMTLSPAAQSCSVTFAGISTTASTRLLAFDAGNTQVASAVAAGTGQQTLTVTGTAIASVAILPGDFNDWVGVDNITCTRTVVAPTKLAITAQPSPSVVVLAPFNVTVQAQNAANAPTNVTSSTLVTLAIQSGTGTLGGTATCTIAVASNSCTVTGISSNAVQTGLVLRATSVPALTSADTTPFDVTAIPQAITGFAPASPVVFGASPATLTATGGASGSPIVFATTSSNTICTVGGNQVTFTGVGVCNLTANQAAAGNYSAAPQVTASITITPAGSVITGFNPPPIVLAGSAPVTLTATGAPSGVPIVFATTSPASVCVVTGNVVVFTGPGICILTANQAAGGNFGAAPQVTVTVTVLAQAVTVPSLHVSMLLLLALLVMGAGLVCSYRKAR